MNDQTTLSTSFNEDDAPDDDSIGASIQINWAEIFAATPVDILSEKPAFDSDDYETDEEEDAAFEAFITRVIEGPDEEA